MVLKGCHNVLLVVFISVCVLKWQDFFSQFYESLPLNLTAENCTVKLSVLKSCLSNQTNFQLGFLICHALLF